MLPLETLGQTTTPDGKELVLYQRAGVYHIRVDGLELMSSRAHGSEDKLAELACEPLKSKPAPRVLIGGLGIGYTLRAALDRLPKKAVVDVAEIFGAIVEWNRGLLASLARRPLDDRRVRVHEADFGKFLAAVTKPYDAILLDVDNGPEAFTVDANARLYEPRGLTLLRRGLTRDGVLTVWSSFQSPHFARKLKKAGFAVRSVPVAARHQGGGPHHTIFVARQRR